MDRYAKDVLSAGWQKSHLRQSRDVAVELDLVVEFDDFCGAVVGWVLGMVDYAPGQATQAPGVLSTINALFTLIPCALFLCMVALLSIYKLNSRLVDSIARELASKRELRPEAGQLSPATPSALQE
mgnify:CR=1 FL=1